MWLPKDIVAAVDSVAVFHYIDAKHCKGWNEQRRAGELRLLTGWQWTARDRSEHRQGFKTMTVAYRDAYYALVRHAAAPTRARPRLRVVLAA